MNEDNYKHNQYLIFKYIYIFIFVAIKWEKSLDVLIYFNKGQRKGKPGGVYRTPKSKRIAPPRYRNLDYA